MGSEHPFPPRKLPVDTFCTALSGALIAPFPARHRRHNQQQSSGRRGGARPACGSLPDMPVAPAGTNRHKRPSPPRPPVRQLPLAEHESALRSCNATPWQWLRRMVGCRTMGRRECSSQWQPPPPPPFRSPELLERAGTFCRCRLNVFQ